MCSSDLGDQRTTPTASRAAGSRQRPGGTGEMRDYYHTEQRGLRDSNQEMRRAMRANNRELSVRPKINWRTLLQ